MSQLEGKLGAGSLRLDVFGVSGAAQLAVLLGQGEFTTDLTVASAIAAVPVALMIPLGVHFRRRLDGPTFEQAVLVVLLLAAVALVLRVVG